jgi:hypothetical protein
MEIWKRSIPLNQSWGPSPCLLPSLSYPICPLRRSVTRLFLALTKASIASLPLAMIVLLERAEQEKPAFGKPDQFARHDFGVLSSLGFH